MAHGLLVLPLRICYAPFSSNGSAEVLSAFEEYCVFKGKTKERNIRGGKSMAFPITGKQEAAYHQPDRADRWHQRSFDPNDGCSPSVL